MLQLEYSFRNLFHYILTTSIEPIIRYDKYTTQGFK